MSARSLHVPVERALGSHVRTRVCLVTGASGFVGTAVCRRLLQEGYTVRCALRAFPLEGTWPPGDRLEYRILGDLRALPDWSGTLCGVDAIVHLAARVHVIKDTAADPAAEFHKVNVDGSRRLAEAAIRAGVRCFVFLSSIKVNGEQTQDRPFTEDAIASPCGPYAQSKWRAEQILHQLARQASMEVVVIRPPLVYGPNVKGNFQELLRLVARGCLLPLGGIRNRRSLIYVENLADLIVHCISHPSATGTFLVSDGQDLSTPDLIRRLGTVLDRQPYLMPVPPTLLHLAGKLLGREDMIRRLCASLTIDSGRVRRLLQWEPPYSLDQGIERTASAYLSQ